MRMPLLQCDDCPTDCVSLDGTPTAIDCACPCHDDPWDDDWDWWVPPMVENVTVRDGLL